MATAANWGNGQPFSIGEVMSQAFAVIRANPVTTFGIAFLLGALPQQLLELALGSFTPTDPTETLGVAALYLMSALISMFFASLVAGAIVRVTVGFAEGEKVSFGESVFAGLRKALPLLVLSLLMSFALVLGFALLLVPGLILLTMWAVASPALVAEDIGVFDAFGRSRHLTKGARWRVFGLGALLIVIFWILAIISGIVVYTAGGIEAMANGETSIPFTIYSVILGTVSSAFIGAVQTTLYLALRDWKDGPESGALADVFA